MVAGWGIFASGATGVHIAEHVRGRQRIVEHVGSAHTEAELGMLPQRAREMLENPAQGVLELGVEPTPPVKGLVAPARDPGLFDIVGTDASTEREDELRKVGYSKNAALIRRSSSVFSLTVAGSGWRSAASKATRPRRQP